MLVSDLVESVRLMQVDEEGTVRRWQALFDHVERDLAPRHGGRIARDTGDGIVVEFDEVSGALACGRKMHAAIHEACAELEPERVMWLRIGLHRTDLLAGRRDVFGHGVNVAARLSTLAGPGETVASLQARDEIVHGLDADVEDLGECYVKHIEQPLRAFRVGPPGPRPVVPRAPETPGAFRPTVAVLTFASKANDGAGDVLAQVLAEDLIAALSTSPHWQVVSRLSSSRLAGRPEMLPREAGEVLGATYVMSGTLSVHGDAVRVFAELADARDGRVVWADIRRSAVSALFADSDELVQGILKSVNEALVRRELERARAAPMPNLDAFALLLNAVSLMHQLGQDSGRAAREILEYLVERYPRAAEPRAWIGKWHFMRVAQAVSEDPVDDTRRARAALRRALDSRTDHAMALALDGHLLAYVDRNLEAAQERLEEALASNPSEPLAWLFLSALHCHRGDGPGAVAAADQAQRLSPLDPLRYFYAIFAAEAELLCGRHERAAALARESVRLNRAHVSSHATLAIALQLAGRPDEARAVAAQLLALRPGASVRRYIDNHPGGTRPHVHLHAQALREAGVPE